MKQFKLIRSNYVSFIKTLGCCCVFAATGFQAGIIGPSLFDFKILTNSKTIAQVAWIVTGRGIGVAIGSFLAGTMATFMNLLLVLAFGLAGSAIFYLVMPLSVTLSITITTSTMAGIMQGISYAGSNMLILKLWAADCPPFLQAVHLSYGIGAFLSPLWVKFFLLVEPDLHLLEAELEMVDMDTSASAMDAYDEARRQWMNGTTTPASAVVSRKFLSKFNHEDVQLFYPFILTAIYPLFAAILFVVLYFKYPDNEVARKPVHKPASGHQVHQQVRRGTIPKAASLPTVSESHLENEIDTSNNGSNVGETSSDANTDNNQHAINRQASPSVTPTSSRGHGTPIHAPLARGATAKEVSKTGSVPEMMNNFSRQVSVASQDTVIDATISTNGPTDASSPRVPRLALEPADGHREPEVRRSERARRQSIVRRDSIITIRRPSMVCVQLYQPEIPHIDTSPFILKAIFVAMTSIMAMTYGGCEQAVGTYIPAFAVKSALKLDKPTGAMISSAYWASITVFQGVAIAGVSYVGVTNTLWIDYVNAVLASVVLYFSPSFGPVRGEYLYWFSCSYLGMSFASLWGAFFSFLEPRINVTNTIVTILSVSFCIGQSGFTALIGLLIDRYPRSFLYFTVTATSSMFTLFVVIFFFSKQFFPERKY